MNMYKNVRFIDNTRTIEYLKIYGKYVESYK